MASTPHIRIPWQRQPEPTCPPFCGELHLGELTGERSHYGAGGTVRLPDGTILVVDVHADDGQRPEVVLHDSDGNIRHIPVDAALAYAAAIVAAAQSALTAAVTA